MPNHQKEVLWRLAVNGVAGAGGHDCCNSGPCPCGFTLTTQQRTNGQATLHRSHAFWDCPVAQGIIQQLQRGVGLQPVLRHHVWLLIPPSPAIQRVVWQVVCLAALTAINEGRKALWRAYISAGGHRVAPTGQDTAEVDTATRHAVQRFWEYLVRFATRDQAPISWAAVGAQHPFLSVDRSSPEQPPRLHVEVPEGIIWSDSEDSLAE